MIEKIQGRLLFTGFRLDSETRGEVEKLMKLKKLTFSEALRRLIRNGLKLEEIRV